MRIMYCLPEMSHPGGIARVTSLKANWLVEHGHEVYIVTTDQKGEDVFYELSDSIIHKDLNTDFRSYENDNVIKKYYKRRKLIALYEQRLKAIVDEWKPEIIVSTFNNESEFLYKWDDGSKKVLEYHFCHEMNNSIIRYGKVSKIKASVLKLKDRQREFLAKQYDAFVVLTNEDAEDWKRIYPYKNLYVIPNMLSFESGLKSTCEEKRVIAVGRLDFQKKFDRLIDVWNIVYKCCPDWKLSIYGNGEDNDMLQRMIDKKLLSDCVKIFEPTKGIREEFLTSSIFVMTSTYEGLPMTLLEASSCGIPSVTYNFKCGPKDVICSGVNGFVVEENNNSQFAKRLVSIMQNRIKRKEMGVRAYEKSRKFSLNSIMESWMVLFCNLVRK